MKRHHEILSCLLLPLLFGTLVLTGCEEASAPPDAPRGSARPGLGLTCDPASNSEDCTSPLVCRQIWNDDDYACLPPGCLFRQDCEDDQDCVNSVCMTKSERMGEGEQCSEVNPCPPHLSCTEDLAGQLQCQRPECYVDADCRPWTVAVGQEFACSDWRCVPVRSCGSTTGPGDQTTVEVGSGEEADAAPADAADAGDAGVEDGGQGEAGDAAGSDAGSGQTDEGENGEGA